MRSLCLAMVLAAVCFTPNCLGLFADFRQFGKAITFFSTDLTKVLSLRTGNVVFSPVSIHMALTMILLGAKGETAREIRTLLEAARMPNLLQYYKLWLDTTNVNCDSQNNCQMTIQNFFWRSPAITHYDEMFLKTLNSTFAPANGRFHFTSGWTQINFWTDIRGSLHWGIQEKKITIEPVFVSAINIALSWKIPFISKKAADMLFVTESNKKVLAWGMRATGKFKYAYSAHLKCHVVRVPLENDRFGFYVIFPRYEVGLAHAENIIARRGVSLDAVFETVRDRMVDLELPKFAVVHKINLEEPLHEMGMHDATSSNADFTRATPRKIKVGQVRHRMLVSLSGSQLRIGSRPTGGALQVSPKNGTHEEAPSPGEVSPKNGTHEEAPSPGDAAPIQKRREVAAAGNATLNAKRSLSVVSTAAPYNTTAHIHASHPFLYFLRDDLKGVLLIHGRLVEPQTGLVTEY